MEEKWFFYHYLFPRGGNINIHSIFQKKILNFIIWLLVQGWVGRNILDHDFILSRNIYLNQGEWTNWQECGSSIRLFLPSPRVKNSCQRSSLLILAPIIHLGKITLCSSVWNRWLTLTRSLLFLHWLVPPIKLVESGRGWCPAWTGLTFCQEASNRPGKVKAWSWQVAEFWKLNLGHEQQEGGVCRNEGGKKYRIED